MTARASNRHLLVVEPRSRGHLLMYVRLLVEDALERGDDVTCALSPDAGTAPEYELHLADLVGRFRSTSIGLPLRDRSVSSAAAHVGADLVVVPHGDELASRYGLPFARSPRVPTRLLVMRDPRWEEPRTIQGRARRAAKLLLLRRASRRRNVDVVWLRAPLHRPDGREHVAVDPFIGTTADDAVVAAAEMRGRWPAPVGTYWFALTGAVSRRKNAPLVVEALLALRARRPDLDVGLAIIGPQDQDVRDGVSPLLADLISAGAHVHVDDRHLSNEEMNHVVAAADAIVLAYSTNAPNSTLGKAYVLGTAIISAGSKTFREYAAPLGGWTAALDVTDLSRAMEAAMEGPAPVRRPDAIGTTHFTHALLADNITSDRR